MADIAYEPLSVESLGARLGTITAITDLLGTDTRSWDIKEVGDGNLNLVFVVKSPEGSLIVKQALPYVRLVGDSWPLPLKRAFFEYHALIRQAKRDPGTVPEVYHFDEQQALIVMEYFTPHKILRYRLMGGEKTEGLAKVLGNFCARTLFRGSDLSMKTAEKKADAALFLQSVELCDITETLVFSDPYFEAERNHHNPLIDSLVKQLRRDVDLKVEAHHLKSKFCSNGETMLHGDFHTGSVMATDTDTRIIDPEFVLYGPMGFDIGMLLANFWMSYYSQPAHAEKPGARDAFQEWILQQVEEIWSVFCSEFAHLWRTERTGILYEHTLFEDQGQALASEQALAQRLTDIWQDTLGFAGIELIRRTLSLAHNADNEAIEDERLRAVGETHGLLLARELVVGRRAMHSISQVHDLVRQIGAGAAL